MPNKPRLLIAILAVAIGSWLLTQGRIQPSAPLEATKVASAPSQLPPLPPDLPAPGSPVVAPEPASVAQLDPIVLMLRNYRTLFGDNPTGSNAEIMRAVMGANPKGSHLGPPEGMSLNDAGELLDQWGSPIFFHQLSARQMEIRSAGPDRKMWTADDWVSH